jgi:hypothetical protein
MLRSLFLAVALTAPAPQPADWTQCQLIRSAPLETGKGPAMQPGASELS